jgi:hypothetical protein
MNWLLRKRARFFHQEFPFFTPWLVIKITVLMHYYSAVVLQPVNVPQSCCDINTNCACISAYIAGEYREVILSKVKTPTF